MIASLLVVSVFVGQLPPYPLRTLPNAHVVPAKPQYSYPKASGTFGTGYIPVTVKFKCDFDYVGPANGCVVKDVIEMDSIDPITGTYWFRGDQPLSVPIEKIQQAEFHISGYKVVHPQAGAIVPFNELYVSPVVVKLDSDRIGWYLHVNWRDNASTMLDNFEVEFSGEIAWSTNVHSELAQIDLSCESETGSCEETKSVTSNFEFFFAGAAFSQLQYTTDDTSVDSFMSAITPSGFNTHTADILMRCEVGGSTGYSCKHRVLVVFGDRSEMEPFTSNTYTYDSATTSFPNDWETPGFSETGAGTSLHREMACGLRQFSSRTTVGPGKFGGMQFGATSVDCGFTGAVRYATIPLGWTYSGPDQFGYYPTPYKGELVLDGAKLLWP